jgi:lipopolysaccharide transport system ATP-binding protein
LRLLREASFAALLHDGGRLDKDNAAAPMNKESPADIQIGLRFDPNLRSSVVEYERNGASIRDVRITTPDGIQVNNLVRGVRYHYQYAVDFTKDFEDVSFGMLIKTVSGVELAGASSEQLPSRRVKQIRAGDSIDVVFTFTCRLMPGIYFTNAGVMGTSEGERRYLHRLLDVLALRVMPQEATLDNGHFSQDVSLALKRA